MALSHKRARRKPTGARYIAHSKKERYYLGSDHSFIKLEPTRKIILRTRGANEKVRLLSSDKANVLDPKTKTHRIIQIKTVVENNANRNFIRRNILTKGAVISTELGNAKVTSRPGQSGTANAVLIQ